MIVDPRHGPSPVAATAEIGVQNTPQQEALFTRLLQGQGNHDINSDPQQALMMQASNMALTVSVDVGAKTAGVISQSINKLANMT